MGMLKRLRVRRGRQERGLLHRHFDARLRAYRRLIHAYWIYLATLRDVTSGGLWVYRARLIFAACRRSSCVAFFVFVVIIGRFGVLAFVTANLFPLVHGRVIGIATTHENGCKRRVLA